MGIVDRVRWSAGRTLSKAREGLVSIKEDIHDRFQSSDADHTPKDVDTSEEPVIDAPTTAPSSDEIVSDTVTTDDTSPVEEDVAEPVVSPRPLATPIPLVRRANRFTRSFRASSRDIDIDAPPLGLSFVGLVALVFASLYLMKLFTSLEAMQDDMSLLKRIFSAGMLLFLFYQYIGYVITIFQLRSAMRYSWAAMVRSSGSYVILMILAETHLFDWLPFDLVSFPSWILMLAMALIMVYMMLPFVREYYKPPYADMVPLTAWLLFIFWVDPYNSSEELHTDIDLEIDI